MKQTIRALARISIIGIAIGVSAFPLGRIGLKVNQNIQCHNYIEKYGAYREVNSVLRPLKER